MTETQNNPETMDNPQTSREWVAPTLTVLNVGSTAGGPVPNTEAFNYAPPLS